LLGGAAAAAVGHDRLDPVPRARGTSPDTRRSGHIAVHISLRAGLPPVGADTARTGTAGQDAFLAADEDRLRGIIGSCPWPMRVIPRC
jgi:hypothetical protein